MRIGWPRNYKPSPQRSIMPVNQMITTTEKINLIMSKIEILKLKVVNGGYDWAHVLKKDQDMLDKCLVEIDELLEKDTHAE